MISKSLFRICSEDISLIENYQEAISSQEKWEVHHRLEDLGFSKKDLIYLSLYYKVPADELVFMSKSAHLSHHNSGEKNPYRKVAHNYRGEKNSVYNKVCVEKDGTREYIPKEDVESYLADGYTRGYTYTGKSRKGKNNNQYGKKDIEASCYWRYLYKGEIPPSVLKAMKAVWSWTPSCYPFVKDKNFKLTDY